MKPLLITMLFALASISHRSSLSGRVPSGQSEGEAGRPVRAGQTQTSIPDTPAGVRLTAFLRAVNSKDSTLLHQFVRDNYAASALSALAPEARGERLRQLSDNRAPLALLGILDSRPDSVVALLKDRDGGQIGLKLDVEPALPHGIVQLRLGDPKRFKEASPVKEYTRWKDLRDLLTQIRADNNVPAMAIAVARGEKHLDQAVVGLREQGKPEKVQIQDRWHIGSISKSMTSTLIAMLIDKGILRWETTLGEALPQIKMDPGYKEVTLEQLLQHRGGIPQDMFFRGEDVDRITKNAKTPTECRAAYIADVLQRAPIARPGERMAYSNAGYTIAGYIAERATGKPYEQLMREMVFLRLGMTTARVGGAGSPGQPQGHVPGRNGLQVMNVVGKLPEMTAPAGNITCSIGDLARFAAFHLAGLQGKGSILKPETFRRLHTPPAVPAGQERYACGWEIVEEWTSEPFHGHGGSNGTFRAQMAIFVKQGLAIVAATNAGGESEPSAPLQAALAVEKRARSAPAEK